jgi:hypothetical protein
MDDNQTETQFIRNCSVMSFDELGIFINDCLEQLEKQSISDIDFPKQERTYNELICAVRFSKVHHLHTKNKFRESFHVCLF